MASLDDVRRVALALPETEELTSRGSLQWKVKGRLFVWERPLRAGDVAALGDCTPAGPVFAVRVPDEGAKFALIADDPAAFFTVPHFERYNAVLIRLDDIGVSELDEVITDAWLDRAPPTVRKRFRQD